MGSSAHLRVGMPPRQRNSQFRLAVVGVLAWCSTPEVASLLNVQNAGRGSSTQAGFVLGVPRPLDYRAGRCSPLRQPRTMRRYWNQPGPQPEQTTEGTVIPLSILAVIAGGVVVYPFVFGFNPGFIAAIFALALVSTLVNVAALAANKNLPSYIDDLLSSKDKGKGK
mmetsp:Transcript_125306/g.348660  ORF Transcript_125306/g.348660 Transcript_125306/m.348660 type:complete len:167 (+) Transcript_125306:138-638(+)